MTKEEWCSVSIAAKALGVSPSTVRRRIAAGAIAARKEPSGGRFRWLVCIAGSADERQCVVEVELRPPGHDTNGRADASGLQLLREPVESESEPPRHDDDDPSNSYANASSLRLLRDHVEFESELPALVDDAAGLRSLSDHIQIGSEAPRHDDDDRSSSYGDVSGLRSLRDHSICALVAVTVLVAAILLRVLPLAQFDSFATVVAGFAALTALAEGSGAFRQWRLKRRGTADHDHEAAATRSTPHRE